MRYCKRKQGNVSDHQCKPVKHPECSKARQVIRATIPRGTGGRKGYCHYVTEYISCDHGYCREKQGESLMKTISGLYNADGFKLGKNAKSSRPKIGRDNVRVSEFRTNRIAKSTGNIDKSRKWRTYANLEHYMAEGKA